MLVELPFIDCSPHSTTSINYPMHSTFTVPFKSTCSKEASKYISIGYVSKKERGAGMGTIKEMRNN